MSTIRKPLLLLATGNGDLDDALTKYPALKQKYKITDRSVTFRESLIPTINDIKPNKVLIFDMLPSQFAKTDKTKILSLTRMFFDLKMDIDIDNKNVVFVSTKMKAGDLILSNIVQNGFYNIVLPQNNDLNLSEIIAMLDTPASAADANYLTPEVFVPDDKNTIQYRIPDSKPKPKVIYENKTGNGADVLSNSLASEMDSNKTVAQQAAEATKKYNKKQLEKNQARPRHDRDAAIIADKMGKKTQSDESSPWDEYIHGALPGSAADSIPTPEIGPNRDKDDTLPLIIPANFKFQLSITKAD